MSQPPSHRDGRDTHTSSTFIISAVFISNSNRCPCSQQCPHLCMGQQGSPSSLAQSPSPSAHFKWDKRVFHRSSQDSASWLHFPIWRGACWKHQERAIPLQDSMELAKLLGSASLWLQQGPTSPGSRSLLIPCTRCSSAHEPGCRGQSQSLVLGQPPCCAFQPSSASPSLHQSREHVLTQA